VPPQLRPLAAQNVVIALDCEASGIPAVSAPSTSGRWSLTVGCAKASSRGSPRSEFPATKCLRNRSRARNTRTAKPRATQPRKIQVTPARRRQSPKPRQEKNISTREISKGGRAVDGALSPLVAPAPHRERAISWEPATKLPITRRSRTRSSAREPTQPARRAVTARDGQLRRRSPARKAELLMAHCRHSTFTLCPASALSAASPRPSCPITRRSRTLSSAR
jgi:hypothetical protein